MNSFLLRESPIRRDTDSTLRFPPHSSTRYRPRPRIGIALSAGGARGLAHVGVIQVLEENNIPVDVIAGTSMGAYVGALWASGCNAAKLADLAAEIRSLRHLFGLVDLAVPFTRGLVHGKKIRERLERTIGQATFGDLAKPFFAVAGNVRTLQRKVFEAGPVGEAVHASIAIPGICVPVEIGGELYVDGGVVEPVPVPVLRQHAQVDRIIAVSVVPTLNDVAKAMPDPRFRPRGLVTWLHRSWNIFATGNLVEILQRSVLCGQVRMAEDACRLADVVIHPSLNSCRWHDYHHWAEYLAAGRKAAEEAMPAIKSLFDEPAAPDGHVPAPSLPPYHENPRIKEPLGLAVC